MTVLVNDTVERYTISGVGPYPFSFRIFAETDIAANACSTATPAVPTPLVYLSDYTVAGANSGSGGTVTLTAGVATTYAGYTLDIRSNTVESQPTSIRNIGRFLPEIHEDAYDNLSRQIQDLNRRLLACVRYPDNTLNDGTMTPLSAWVSKYLTINSSGILTPSVLGSTTLTAAIITSLISGSTTDQDALLALFLERTDTSPGLDSLRRTPSEIAASVFPVNYSYAQPDLRRYATNVFSGDQTAAINNAILAAVVSGGPGYIYHPGGTISHASQITIPNGLTVLGRSRVSSIFQFTGTPSGSPAATRAAWRYTGIAPWSGYANVAFKHVQIYYQNAVNFASAIELTAWGWSYFEIEDVWIRGNCSYGLILDGTEITSVHHCLIENLNATSNRSIWIVNGADRGFSQGQGFSNRIDIFCNQISNGAGSYGILDDGGNSHTIVKNNFNQNSIPLYVAGVQNLTLGGNSYETTLTTGPANVYFASVSGDQGVPVGPVRGFSVKADGFYGNISGGALLVFTGTLYNISAITKAASAVITFSTAISVNPFIVGEQIFVSGVVGMTQINNLSLWVTAIGGVSGAWTATVLVDSTAFTVYASGGQAAFYHRGGEVTGCCFGGKTGRGGAVDVAFLANSTVGPNVDESVSSSFTHYINVHNDVQGNFLRPPQNGFIGTVGINGPTWGDNRYAMQFQEGVTSSGQFGANGAAPPAQITGFGAPTGTAVVNNFPGATATLLQTSQTVAEILAILKGAGVIGT